MLEPLGVHVQSMPDLSDIISGVAHIDEPPTQKVGVFVSLGNTTGQLLHEEKLLRHGGAGHGEDNLEN